MSELEAVAVLREEDEAPRGFDFEEVRALYFNPDALREASYRLVRIDPGRKLVGRWYACIADGEVTALLPSVTTVIDRTTPTSERLIDWRVSLGDKYYDVLNEKAEYGTAFHMLVAHLLVHGALNVSRAGLFEVLMESGKVWRYVQEGWYSRLASDILAVRRWMEEYEVTPYAVEVGLASSVIGAAGTVDLVCSLMQPKGVEREVAVVDFKSGKNFYPSHKVQLAYYRALVYEQFPDLSTEGDIALYNVGPKDWRREPTYNVVRYDDVPRTLVSSCRLWWDQFEGDADLDRKVRLYSEDEPSVVGFGVGWGQESVKTLYTETTVRELILQDMAEQFLSVEVGDGAE